MHNLARRGPGLYSGLVMERPTRISVKDVMQRYNISERTAVRWRKGLREAGLLVSASPESRTVVGDWREIDRAIALGSMENR